jgi:hypothetical protein
MYFGARGNAEARRYLQQVPGDRPHIPVAPDAPISELSAIAERYPVFRVTKR